MQLQAEVSQPDLSQLRLPAVSPIRAHDLGAKINAFFDVNSTQQAIATPVIIFTLHDPNDHEVAYGQRLAVGTVIRNIGAFQPIELLRLALHDLDHAAFGIVPDLSHLGSSNGHLAEAALTSFARAYCETSGISNKLQIFDRPARLYNDYWHGYFDKLTFSDSASAPRFTSLPLERFARAPSLITVAAREAAPDQTSSQRLFGPYRHHTFHMQKCFQEFLVENPNLVNSLSRLYREVDQAVKASLTDPATFRLELNLTPEEVELRTQALEFMFDRLRKEINVRGDPDLKVPTSYHEFVGSESLHQRYSLLK